MFFRTLALMVAFLVGLTACDEKQAPSPQATPAPVTKAPQAEAPPTETSTAALEPAAATSTPTVSAPVVAPDPAKVAAAAAAANQNASPSYGMLRQQILATGWAVVNNGQCLSNVAGPNAAQICEALPELDACSADGYCKFVFQRTENGQAQTLEVVTYGEIQDWNVATNSRLAIRSMGINPPPAGQP